MTLRQKLREIKVLKISVNFVRDVLLQIKTVFDLLVMRLFYFKHRCRTDKNNNIIFWSPGGMPGLLEVEGSIASACKLRGANVKVILCDGIYTACVLRQIDDQTPISKWKDKCRQCVKDTTQTIKKFDVSVSYISEWVSKEELDSVSQKVKGVTWKTLFDIQFQGVAIGRLAGSSIYRYLQGKDQPDEIELVERYLESAYINTISANKCFDSLKPDLVFMSHGIYVDWAPALHLAILKKIPVYAWSIAYLSFKFYFRKVVDNRRINFHYISDNLWSNLKLRQFTLEQEEELNSYMSDRYNKNVTFDMKSFKPRRNDPSENKRVLGLDESKPTWGIFTHMNWDSVRDYSPMIYETFNEWIIDTIKAAILNNRVNWIIKVHPADGLGDPRYSTGEIIKEKFPSLPSHVTVLYKDYDINPFDFYQLIDGAVTVYGTAGLEVAAMGKPTIVAGDAHYAGKGFTYDGLTREQYITYLNKTDKTPSLTKKQQELAKKYAYHFFLSRQIPVPSIKTKGKGELWYFSRKNRKMLLPGNNPFIDFICDRLESGEEFIMDDRLLEQAKDI